MSFVQLPSLLPPLRRTSFVTLCRIAALVALLTQSLDANAAPCASNPRIPPAMKDALARLKPRWFNVEQPPAFDAGAWNTLKPILSSGCATCHANPPTGEPPAGVKYPPRIDWTNPVVVADKCAAMQGVAISASPLPMPPGGLLPATSQNAMVAFCRTVVSTTEYGLSEVFYDDPNGVCYGCHQRTNPQSDGYKRYEACGNCHSRVLDAQGNDAPYWLLSDGAARHPEWLNFGHRAGHLLKSYYLPGRLKGEAMSKRATDGTMPPGANATTATASPPGEKVGWCDEITTTYDAWVKAGFPW